MHIFNYDMPRKVEPFVRNNLIASHCKTYYYEFRNGTRLISPAIQEEISDLFREAGWKEDVHFDSYVEDPEACCIGIVARREKRLYNESTYFS